MRLSFMERLLIAALLILAGRGVATLLFAQSSPSPTATVLFPEELDKLVQTKLGYQGYISITKKPVAVPDTANPFKFNLKGDQWYVYDVEVGTNQFGGRVTYGHGITYGLAWDDVIKNHPGLK